MILFNFVAFLFKEFDPDKFIHFKNKIVVKKLDARKYEESLKAEFTSWIKNGHTEEVIFTCFWQNPMFLVFLSCIVVIVIIIIIITIIILVFNLNFRPLG